MAARAAQRAARPASSGGAVAPERCPSLRQVPSSPGCLRAAAPMRGMLATAPGAPYLQDGHAFRFESGPDLGFAASRPTGLVCWHDARAAVAEVDALRGRLPSGSHPGFPSPPPTSHTPFLGCRARAGAQHGRAVRAAECPRAPACRRAPRHYLPHRPGKLVGNSGTARPRGACVAGARRSASAPEALARQQQRPGPAALQMRRRSAALLPVCTTCVRACVRACVRVCVWLGHGAGSMRRDCARRS